MRNSSRTNASRYLVGIDLGTTHTVVAYVDTQEKEPEVRLFPIQQLVAPGEIDERPMLPSVRYHPTDGELIDADTRLPWPKPDIGDNVPQSVVGALARQLGSKTRGRQITSAKSWLCHGAVDRTADILPWGAPEGVAKISPVLASADFLSHIRSAWNLRFRSDPLENQSIVVTVPASFDEAARALTVEAADSAGLNGVKLLEEPQAVFYDWLMRHQHNLITSLQNIRLVLICDVGGGTTDFTLIQIETSEDDPKLSRIGVGDHLMLGGDNIDLALAHRVEKQLESGNKRLSTAELFQLLEQCRSAKEKLLSDNAPECAQVTLLGSGAKLIGGARTVDITKNEVREIVLDGFFPKTAFEEISERRRSGVVEFGLPYVADPAVSKHIAAFLKYHAQACRKALDDEDGVPVPDAILLNGGVFRSPIITNRVLELIGSWSGKTVTQLENPRPDLSVAYGAVAYALSRRTGKIQRIGGGSARSYFLSVESEDYSDQQGVCILPKATEENTGVRLSQRTFLLKLDQPVRFHLVSTTEDTEYQAGDMVDIEEDRFISLPPLATAMDRKNLAQNQEVPVQLLTTLTEVGTLQLQCVSVNDSGQRWDVEFQVRKQYAMNASSIDRLPHSFPDAAKQVQLIFGKKSKQLAPKAIKGLRAELEKLMGPRIGWNTTILRALFGVLLEGIKHRRRSANHERIWLSLSGYCLRPGFGDSLDDWRIEQLWRMYSQNLQFTNESQNWSEWWTLWRRVAGGLDTGQQQQIFDDISKFINPATARQGKTAATLKKRGYDDMVRLAGVLERLGADKKIMLGGWLLKRLQKASESHQTWWALGRIGARVPFHGSTHNLVPKHDASQWLNQILELDWKKAINIPFAATMIARMNGDREWDIDAKLRDNVVERLGEIKAPTSWVEMVQQRQELDEADEKRIFGEALPPGLKLLN